MTKAFCIRAIAIIGVIAAMFLARSGPASGTTATSSVFQNRWQQALEPIGMGLVGHGYMVAFKGGGGYRGSPIRSSNSGSSSVYDKTDAGKTAKTGKNPPTPVGINQPGTGTGTDPNNLY